jgi:hypothetical protein
VVSGLGMGLFFVPISALAFQNVGCDRQDEASGIYGVARSIGSSVGIAVVGWQVAARTQFHWSVLVQDITPFRPEVAAWLAPLGLSPTDPAAAAQLSGVIARQAQMLAFQDAFALTGWAAFAMLPFVALMQSPGRAPRPGWRIDGILAVPGARVGAPAMPMETADAKVLAAATPVVATALSVPARSLKPALSILFDPGIRWIGARLNRPGSDVPILPVFSWGLRPPGALSRRAK